MLSIFVFKSIAGTVGVAGCSITFSIGVGGTGETATVGVDGAGETTAGSDIVAETICV